MNSLRRWLYRPKKSDSSLLAQFYFNDEELNAVAVEVDSIDGRKDPERCAELVNKLRTCQDRVLTTIQLIMAEAIPDRRTSRDFRVKFPDDVVQENLAGQLWFGAECLAAGSSIMNREEESTSMRPLARALTKNLDSLRCILREQCIRCLTDYSERIKEALVIFDKLFAEFELSYVSAMVPVKTRKEYEMIQEITVLFSETVQRALKQGHLTRDMIDEYDPALMFTIPRLAIVCGLLIYPEGPLNPDNPPTSMSDMFRPFQPLLFKIRELLSTLTSQELYSLEHALCTSEGQPLLTVLESQVSSSDNACQTDFDPSSPARACPPASLPSPTHPPSPQGAECSSGSSAALETCSSEGRGLAELQEEPDPTSQACMPPAAACTGGAEEKEAAVEVVEERDEEEEGKEANGQRAMLEEERRKEDVTGEMEEEELEAAELTNCKLNKSESNDSGLHSEYASHSENLTVSYSDSQQTLSLADSAAPSPLESPTYTMGSSEGAGCLEETKGQTGTISEEEMEERSGNCPEEVSGSVSRDMVCSSRTNSGGSASDSGVCCGDCCLSAGDRAAEVEVAKLHVAEGSSKRPDVLELQKSLKDDFEVECECDGESPSRQQSPSHSCHLAPFPAGAGASPTAQPGPPLGIQPCASSSQPSLPQGTQTGEIDVVVLEEDCVFSDAVIDAATGSNSCAKPKLEEPSAIASDSEESDGDGSENENTSSSDETNEGEGDGKEDGAQEVKEDSSSEEEETDGQSAAVAELSLEGLSVGDLTSMENLIAGTVDLNGNRSARPPLPPSIQARVGGAGPPQGEGGDCLRTPRVQRLRYAESCTSSCSGSVHSSPARDNQWEKESACSIASSETSSYNSECRDEEEIAMAIQAAEAASRNEARMRFRSSSDMIHRLFMVISGVADQLQTNFASDLRHILRAVFDMNCSEPLVSSDLKEAGILSPEIPHRRRPRSQMRPRPRQLGRAAPEWVPDEQCTACLACSTPFTLIRRRHHCRNCGKIYCGRCSSNFVPLPHYGHPKPVRVCNRCFMFQVTAFTMNHHS